MGEKVSEKVMKELLELSATSEDVLNSLTDTLVQQDLNRKTEALSAIYSRWLKLQGEIKKAERFDVITIVDGKEHGVHSKKAYDGLKGLREKSAKLERIFRKALDEDDYGDAFNVAKDKGDGGGESKEADSSDAS